MPDCLLGIVPPPLASLPVKLARVEVSPEEMPRALTPEMAAAMADRLKDAGFTYVTLDLQGYRQGSLNETLSPIGRRSAKTAHGT